MNIVFVCTGNTCRSPMAEGICRKILKEKNIDNISVSSAGISAFPGDGPSENAVIVCKENGIDISSHKARKINMYLIDETDVFICLSQSHKSALSPYCEKGSLILLNDGISDPYGGDCEVYRKCFNEIYDGVLNFIEKLSNYVFILPFSKEFVKDVAELEKECFTTPWSENLLKEELSSENSSFFVAVKDGEAIGYIGTKSVCGECYITNICVKKERRKTGTGSRLLEKAILKSLSRNDEFITLEVRKSNADAIRLYKKFGFEILGERKNFYRLPDEDGYIMTKKF